jgi:hypothetical protein
MAELKINEYYELVALHRALHAARFAREPLLAELPGSPFLADISRRVVETLAQMEIERGQSSRAKNWHVPIVEHGEVWRIAVRNAATIPPHLWNNYTHEQKVKIGHIFLSPFVFTNEMVETFIHQVGEQIT